MKPYLIAAVISLFATSVFADAGRPAVQVTAYKNGLAYKTLSGTLDELGGVDLGSIQKTGYSVLDTYKGKPAFRRSTYETGFASYVFLPSNQKAGKSVVRVQYDLSEITGNQDNVIYGVHHSTPIITQDFGSQSVVLKPGVETVIAGSGCTAPLMDMKAIGSCKMAFTVKLSPL